MIQIGTTPGGHTMEVGVIEEAGFMPALIGMGLSHGLTSGFTSWSHTAFDNDLERKLVDRAGILAAQEGGHNKFLESIQVWIDVRAPRYWWQEFDTYRIGVTKQSESTMHTLTRDQLTQNDFMTPIPSRTLEDLNTLIRRWKACKEVDLDPELLFREIKLMLPEGFMQRRVVCTNYKALRGMYRQRKNHRLMEWRFFFEHVLYGLESPEFITSERKVPSNAKN